MFGDERSDHMRIACRMDGELDNIVPVRLSRRLPEWRIIGNMRGAGRYVRLMEPRRKTWGQGNGVSQQIWLYIEQVKQERINVDGLWIKTLGLNQGEETGRRN